MDQMEVAVIVHMHWPLGKVLAFINSKHSPEPWMLSPRMYVNEFKKVCASFKVFPNTRLLHECIAIGFADNAGSDQPCPNLSTCLNNLERIIEIEPLFSPIKEIISGQDLIAYYQKTDYWTIRKWNTHGKKLRESIRSSWEDDRFSVWDRSHGRTNEDT